MTHFTGVRVIPLVWVEMVIPEAWQSLVKLEQDTVKYYNFTRIYSIVWNNKCSRTFLGSDHSLAWIYKIQWATYLKNQAFTLSFKSKLNALRFSLLRPTFLSVKVSKDHYILYGPCIGFPINNHKNIDNVHFERHYTLLLVKMWLNHEGDSDHLSSLF